ncbi:hypothetical protein BWD12_14550 [Leptospira santarosai serovar Bananal]|nr:hypothetical protein BV917_13150 [Leptospira santarosai serovar Guaricura]OLY64818.1 hypothetical protein BWD11_07175 [Leptospira santarosai serovar Grippotyphosa]ONF77751.1 hypothetical protein BWD12_14550 [Leptospira santarosai serovar Bananal]
MRSLDIQLDISLLEKQQARHEARGRLSPPKTLITISPNQLTTRRVSVSIQKDNVGNNQTI